MHDKVKSSIWLKCLSVQVVATVLYLIGAPAIADPYKAVSLDVRSLDLTRAPTTEQLVAAGQLGGKLHPTSDIPIASIKEAANLDFGIAIEKWNRHDYKEAVRLFQKHILEQPHSPWVDEAYLHIGCDATYNGRYVEAEKNFSTILNRSETNAHPGAIELATKARIRMGNLRSLQNNFSEATDYFTKASDFASKDDWRTRTYASHWIQRLSRYKGNQIAMANCGSQALARLLEKDGKPEDARQVAEMLPNSEKGFAANELTQIAAQYGYELSGRKVTGDELEHVKLPAIIPISAQAEGNGGHYWVLEQIEGSTLTLFDPQSGRTFNQTAEELAQQWQGQVLIFAKAGEFLPGIQLAESEMQEIFGACCGLPRPEDDLGKPRGPEKKCPHPDNRCNKYGAPVWSVNSANLNFFVEDVPLWYAPAIGPGVEIGLSYNSQSANNQYEIFGNKWQFAYASYLVVDTGGQVVIYMPDGRRDLYTPKTGGGYTPPTGTFDTLVKLAENSFELQFKDGSVWVYSIPSGTSSLQPFLTQMKDARGQALRFGFDASVRLNSITDALNQVTTLSYNAAGLVGRVADPFGRAATFTYDAAKNLTSVTDMGGYTTSFTYDANVYMTSMNGATGNWAFATRLPDGYCTDQYPAPGARMCENYQIKVTNPMGGIAEYWYDGYHRESWYASPRYFDPTSTVATPSSKRINYDVSTAGEVWSVSYAGLTSKSMSYTNGNLTTKGSPGAIPGSYTFTYDAKGNVLTSTSPTSVTTTFNYAANGVDLTSIVDPLGTTTLAYNGFHEITSMTDKLGRVRQIAWNAQGQITSETDPLGNVTSYNYDGTSKRLASITRAGLTLASFTYDNLGRLATSTNADGITLTYAYNALNDVTRLTWPDGKYEQITYSAQYPHLVTSVTDRAGRVTSFTHDNMNRVTQTSLPDGRQIKYRYDADGNMVALTDPMGAVTSFEYDAAGRLVTRKWPDGKTETYGYTGFHLTSIRDSKNQNKTTNYNSLGLVTSDAAGTYAYDSYGRMTSATAAGGATTVYTYNALGEVLTVDGPLLNDTITYSYDSNGRVTGYSLQGGAPVNYAWDSLDRLTAVTVNGATHSYTYSGASGAPATLTRPSGLATSYSYDSLKRLSGVLNQTSSNSIISRYVYAYDAQDRRSSESVNIPAIPTPSFQHTPQTYGYNNILNQVTQSALPNRAYTYDANGNQTQGFTPDGYQFAATYDSLDRLTNIQFTGAGSVIYITSFAYDSNGFVVNKKQYSGSTKTSDVNYVRRGVLLLQERDAITNAVIRDYAWGANMGGGIGGLLSVTQSGMPYAYLYDGRGNVTGVSNASQAMVAYYAYDAFGNKIHQSGSLDQPFQFSTKPYDARFGLHDFGFRFYNPEHGRWINRDPIRESGGLNLYEFVEGRPIDKTDPLGLDWFRNPNLPPDDWVVGRTGSIIEPNDPISRFIENYVPAGRTLGEIHDPFVEKWRDQKGYPDWLVNIPSMPYCYAVGVKKETGNSIEKGKKALGRFFYDMETAILRAYKVNIPR